MTKEAQSLLDLILPKLYVDGAILTDTEASTLYRLWNESPTGARVFKTPSNLDSKSIFALKSKGYIAGYGESLELTDKGKKVLVEMVTNEPNAFEKKSDVSYSKIKAKHANMRPRQAFVKRASLENEVKPFNLKRQRNAGNDNEAKQS
jgi:hypothetical protein